MPKFFVTLSIDIDDDKATTDDAESWAASMLDTAFKKKNPETPEEAKKRRPFGMGLWTPEVPMPASEHPYRPKVVGATRIE